MENERELEDHGPGEDRRRACTQALTRDRKCERKRKSGARQRQKERNPWDTHYQFSIKTILSKREARGRERERARASKKERKKMSVHVRERDTRF